MIGFIKKLKIPLVGLLAVSFIYTGIQTCRKPQYYNKIFKETIKITLDSIMDNSPKIKDDEIYVDLHMHIYNPSHYKKGIEEIVDTAMKKVDLFVIMNCHEKYTERLNYEIFKEKLKDSTKYKIKDYGRYIQISTEDDKVIAIKSQEIGCESGRDVLAIGTDKIEPYQKIEKVIEEIHKQAGIAIVAHPMSLHKKKFIPYSTANEEEKEALKKIYHKADAIEEFNSQNYFWMCSSNVLAKIFVENNNTIGTAGSDMHGDLKQIGLSGIIIKKNLLDINNLINDLKKVIKDKKFKVHKEYTDPISFFKTMIVPFFKKTRLRIKW